MASMTNCKERELLCNEEREEIGSVSPIMVFENYILYSVVNSINALSSTKSITIIAIDQ